MTTAAQLKTLIKSFSSKDSSKFFSTILQVAAKEESKGHRKLAEELRILAHNYQEPSSNTQKRLNPKVHTFRKINTGAENAPNIDGLLHLTSPDFRLSSMVLDNCTETEIRKIIVEYRQKDRLSKYSLTPRRKILLVGPPGTGKTLTASVLSTELKLPLYTLQFDGLISRYLGETAAKLRAVFETISTTRAIYFFDEFDAIGAHRDASNDVGEIRRVLNSFLQFFENDTSESLILCATNHPELLDKALFRRFDCIIDYGKPGSKQVRSFIENKLFLFNLRKIKWDIIERELIDYNYAELAKICEEAAKGVVLLDNDLITEDDLIRAHKIRGAQ